MTSSLWKRWKTTSFNTVKFKPTRGVYPRVFFAEPPLIYLDTETYSEVPIKDGTYAYTAACEVMLLTWAVEGGEVQCWDATRDEMPKALRALLTDTAQIIIAHNSMFDRNVLRYALGIDTPLERWWDTMAQAYSHGLPGSLDELGEIFGLRKDHVKIKDGKRLIYLFCKPRPTSSTYVRATKETHPQEWAAFIDYAKADITAMRELHKRLPRWNYKPGTAEHALWCLDQKINDRGIPVDVKFAQAALRAVAKEQRALKSKTADMTGGELGSTTQRNATLEYLLREYGVYLPDMRKDTVQRRVNDQSLPAALRDLLTIRLQASSTSSSKYKSLLKAVSADGRLRGTKQFRGAARTGRWAGRTFQPDNLPRYNLDVVAGEMQVPITEVEDVLDTYLSTGASVISAGCEDLVFGNVMALASNCVRSAVAAPQGKKFVVADLANIEGRVLAWIAGEDWKLQAFRDYDKGEGPDLYVLAYARAFAMGADQVSKQQRQVGKMLELMSGYQGGVGAYVTGAATYNMDLADMARRARGGISSDVWSQATKFYDWIYKNGGATYLLSPEVFCVCDSLKRMWRAANPKIAALWGAVENNVRCAVMTPGETVVEGRLKFRADGKWLRIGLPSGRVLCYPGVEIGKEKGALSYQGTNPYTRKWSKVCTYGGKLVENIVQAVACDVLASSMQPAEDAGYEIVLHVHDELVTETPDSTEFTAGRLSEIMAASPAWAPGLPLAAAGFEATRYKKG